MIKKENKLIQITLDPETLTLLNSLADRFHISKTDTIKQALKVFGASKKHHYHVYINDEKSQPKQDKQVNTQNNDTEEPTWDELMDKIYKE